MQKKAEIEEKMAAPSFYADGKKVAETQREYDRVAKELEDLENLWLNAIAS